MGSRKFHYRRRLINSPPYYGSGEGGILLPQSLVTQKAEFALVIKFMMRRFLFGLSYWHLQPDYFDTMPPGSGVFIKPFVQTRHLFPGRNKPGDIDLLIIPYEGNSLVLERALAVEFKVIRASFERQSKSPNDYGFSQAESLLDIGLPYAAVGHLIVSDNSPYRCWKEIACCEVVNKDGLVSEPRPVFSDPMPSDLVERAHGRLLANRRSPLLGLLACYLTFFGDSAGYVSTHMPSGTRALLNPNRSKKSLDAVASYFERNYRLFLRTPRYDPDNAR